MGTDLVRAGFVIGSALISLYASGLAFLAVHP